MTKIVMSFVLNLYPSILCCRSIYSLKRFLPTKNTSVSSAKILTVRRLISKSRVVISTEGSFMK